ncbi:MAG: hypothetical protein A2675_03110 [Candidatus Yonathbacteria bacterium RIFCSPHIGHO2_01_FULL_51_10]|uniref:Uncharacterized protein n=1 Tax=Candidatus Yonathbacteria bacterium RIFCSPHIGHO2_01_FULL_51_10 TaxID=1802723 RepID=A0A1G2S3H4_9BACT|nr:MAG: hypothetical protein A2675_03110 [Candidatus Yonathbacteria bacterium RIFCSPHIGHO2_01_FULL_51_10]
MPLSGGIFICFGCGGQRANCFALVGIEQPELCRFATGEAGEEVVMSEANYELDPRFRPPQQSRTQNRRMAVLR